MVLSIGVEVAVSAFAQELAKAILPKSIIAAAPNPNTRREVDTFAVFI